MTCSKKNTRSFEPDKFGRIGTISADGSAIATYKYIGQRVAQKILGSVAVYQPSYDNLGRITSADSRELNSGALFAKLDYQYAVNTNNISQETYSHRSGAPYAQFTYDKLSRVTRSDYKGSASAPFNNQYETFGMDKLGNRSGSQHIRDGNSVSYTVDAATNQYTHIGSIYPTYDYAGNMTKDDANYTYTYDYENRPLTITKNGQTKAKFAYDALGRRIDVNDVIAGTRTKYYYNTNWQVLCEKNAAGTTQRWYVYGNYIDEPLMMKLANGSRFYYIQDHLYNTVALAANIMGSGMVLERYEYDAYGKPRIMDGDYNVRATSSYGNPYMFTGRNSDRFDNGNLLLGYNYHRYLKYSIGCWMTPDPLGVVPNDNMNPFNIIGQYSDGMNLYGYVKSNPLSLTDQSGLCCLSGSCPLPPDPVTPLSPSPSPGLKKCPPGKVLKKRGPPYNPKDSANGCGPADSWWPYVLGPLPYLISGTSFTSACNFHDTCYGTYNRNKSSCDNIFHNLMRNACTAANPINLWDRAKCNFLADSYYNAVKNHGGDAYINGQNNGSECSCP